MDILVLIASAITIILGSYLATTVAEALQYHYSDAFIVGIIALLQTLPEYAFVVILTREGHHQFSIASIIGANILLIALGFPLVLLIAYLAKAKGIREDKTLDLMRENSVESIFLALSGVYMIYMGWKGYIDIIDSVVLLTTFIVYIYTVTHLPPEVEEEEPKGLCRVFLNRKKLGFVIIVLGSLLIWFSAEIFTDALLEYLQAMSIGGLLLVMVIMPLVSEFPESMTAFIAATKNEDMARLGVTNFMSSRINNGTLLFSSMLLTAYIYFGVTEIPINSVQFPQLTRFLIMAGILSILGALTTVDRRVSVAEAIVLFSLYILLSVSIIYQQLLFIADILMVVLALIIVGYALKDKRFYWFSDLKYTLSLLRRKSSSSQNS